MGKKKTPVNQIPILFYISLRRIGNCIAIISYTDFTNILNHLGNFIWGEEKVTGRDQELNQSSQSFQATRHCQAEGDPAVCGWLDHNLSKACKFWV